MGKTWIFGWQSQRGQKFGPVKNPGATGVTFEEDVYAAKKYVSEHNSG